MIKKETFVIIGCVILFVLLAVLCVCEMNNPEGGVAIIQNLISNISG